MFRPASDRTVLVSKLVLEHRNETRARNDDVIEMLEKSGLTTLKVVVELHQHRVQRHACLARPVPMIGVRGKLLTRAVSIEAKALVQPN